MINKLKGTLMKKLILALALISTPVMADADINGYFSLGTAFKLVSNTGIPYSSASVPTTFTSATTAGTYRILCTSDCYVNLSAPSATTPTATTSSTFIPGYSAEYFVLGPKTNIAVVRSSTDGTLNIGKTGR